MKKVTLATASQRILLFMLAMSLCLGFLCQFSAIAEKQFDYDALIENYTGEYVIRDETHKASKDSGMNNSVRHYMYEDATVKNFAHLFWAINMYDVTDDEAIDEYMRVNECEIYKNYSTDKFEWKEIRDATRDFIKENKREFPTRFELILPLKLGDYDEKKQVFEIQDEYKIDSLRRFEVYATDFKTPPCSDTHIVSKGYPRVLVIELSRPFNLVNVPMAPSLAADYMKRKLIPVSARYDARSITKKKIFKYRTAYLVLKAKIFTYGKMLGSTKFGVNTVQVMGILEGYEIYEYTNKMNLFFAQNYVTSDSTNKLTQHLKSQYDLLLQKHKGEGILH